MTPEGRQQVEQLIAEWRERVKVLKAACRSANRAGRKDMDAYWDGQYEATQTCIYDLESLPALLLADALPQLTANKEDTDTRVDDSQYPSKPLATASENEVGPTESHELRRRLVALALRERLAALAHDQWAGWMRHLFSKCEPFRDGYRIPHEWALRWERQMGTPYARLSERDKDSDRTEADRVIAVLNVGGGNQPPSGLRGDPGVPRTVDGEARDPSSSSSAVLPRSAAQEEEQKKDDQARGRTPADS